ncbi:unnamed protein product [Fusarium graminearum]|nr:unnamed protein product [Fusarium graminearum]CAG2004159.1 unnamed protein product [Fusarium graminearum]
MDCGIVWEPERCAVMPQYLKGLEGLTEGHVRLHLLREFLHLSVELSIRALDQAVVDTFLDQLRKVQTVPRNPEDVGHGLRRRRTKHGDDFLLIIDFTVEVRRSWPFDITICLGDVLVERKQDAFETKLTSYDINDSSFARTSQSRYDNCMDVWLHHVKDGRVRRVHDGRVRGVLDLEVNRLQAANEACVTIISKLLPSDNGSWVALHFTRARVMGPRIDSVWRAMRFTRAASLCSGLLVR